MIDFWEPNLRQEVPDRGMQDQSDYEPGFVTALYQWSDTTPSRDAAARAQPAIPDVVHELGLPGSCGSVP